MNRKTVLAFLLGALTASVVSVLIHSYQSPAIEKSAASATTAPAALPASPAPADAAPAAAMPMGDGKAGSIDTLTDRLRARLEKEPNDVNGWVLLARSYHFLQRFDEAKAAFAKAKSLGYQGEEDQMPAGADNSGAASADPVFESVARAAQQQAARLQQAPATTEAGK